MTSAAVGVGGAAISAVNPTLAVGLQLGNQILGMPATVLTQSLALPLTRRLGAAMGEGRYPRSIVATWAALAAAVPLLGVVALLALRPIVYRIMGPQTTYAYFFLPVILAQVLALQPWQPFSWARRWTHGPATPRRHVVITVGVYYAAMIAIAVGVHGMTHLRDYLTTLTVVMLITVYARCAMWWHDSRDWTPEQQHLPARAE